MEKMAMFFLLLLSLTSLGQENKSYVINPGQRIKDVIPLSEIYKYSSFKDGQVSFLNNATSSESLNYNLILGEMQFIAPNGDTLSIADVDKIKTIIIDTDSFIYNNGWLEKIGIRGGVKLVKKQIIRETSVTKNGVLDQPTRADATSYSNFSSGATDVNLIINQQLNFRKETFYYFIDEQDKIFMLTNKNLKKLLPQYAGKFQEIRSNKSISSPIGINQIIA
ncbi:MAG TPA: hypothetical protein VGO09_01900, partial [Flavisolibacter sp.]|nr:hypothetical protein [Flavisolibacter sp.]